VRGDLAPHLGGILRQLGGLAPAEVCDAHGLLGRMLVMLRLTAPDGEPATPAARQLVASACGEPGWPQLLAAHDAARQEIANWWASIRPAAPLQETQT
jgi:glutamate-ammonia-ligase adenylyltransferase